MVMSISISVQKHNSCNDDVSGKVNVVSCNAVKLLLLWCRLGNKFENFRSESFLYKILECVSPALLCF